ncbi:MGMT family protein [Cumulibacter manganitolerans]|uniref:MGMT family protein n=1 Tax=Cumulibacter manganitolerans TaxID=1884992 RepID=UPI0012948D32|nr:MGMT family protein [Cumulibacter manganitolerans]
MTAARERVRAVADAIPAGAVMTYGEIGRATGLHPRHVGRIVATITDEIPWWRIVFADGSPATCHDGGAAELLRQERVPFAGAKVSWAELRDDRRRGPGGPTPTAAEPTAGL